MKKSVYHLSSFGMNKNSLSSRSAKSLCEKTLILVAEQKQQKAESMCDRWRRYEELIRSGEEDQLMKMIRRREDMNAADGTQGKTLVHLAAEHGRFCVDMKVPYQKPSLWFLSGQLTLLERLVAREANLHVKTRATKDTPAHLAVRHGHFKVLDSI
jgi:hypothetical protein